MLFPKQSPVFEDFYRPEGIASPPEKHWHLAMTVVGSFVG
jgi:hypothetical protein